MKPLSERAKHRLRLAAGLLRGTGPGSKDLGLSRDGFYDGVQSLIASLPMERQTELKELVDWVESYDNAPSPAPGQQRNAQGA